jgi:peptidoglycan/LPS O-acetylase OafA/YrhL
VSFQTHRTHGPTGRSHRSKSALCRRFLLDLVHLAYAATVIAVAALSYRFIERPGQKYFKSVADRMAASNLARLGGPAAPQALLQGQENR